ncbi:hypothetical protein KCU88_g2492, partial [Aureobasidium melanogenum]
MGLFPRSSRTNPNPKHQNDDPFTTTASSPPLSSFHRRPTALRLFTALIYLISLVFLILVEIGNINNKPVIRSTYFLKISLANIIPSSVPNAVFINSIAQSIGLHDFYQVGLWNFCEGYNGEGITHCSHTKTLYWFNPVEIILSELLAGASITLPTEVVNILDLSDVDPFGLEFVRNGPALNDGMFFNTRQLLGNSVDTQRVPYPRLDFTLFQKRRHLVPHLGGPTLRSEIHWWADPAVHTDRVFVISKKRVAVEDTLAEHEDPGKMGIQSFSALSIRPARSMTVAQLGRIAKRDNHRTGLRLVECHLCQEQQPWTIGADARYGLGVD